LDHESFDLKSDLDWLGSGMVFGSYHAMEFTSFVALWLASTTLRLAGAELTKILSRFGNDIFE
jgi:hypothetical protein